MYAKGDQLSAKLRETQGLSENFEPPKVFVFQVEILCGLLECLNYVFRIIYNVLKVKKNAFGGLMNQNYAIIKSYYTIKLSSPRHLHCLNQSATVSF